MSKKLKLKEGDVYRITVKNGQLFLLEDVKASERVGVDDAELTSNNGEINWLFVFGLGFLAIAAFHLFVK